MKILFTASECEPFIKTGGLADVVGALAPVLAEKGHDVRVILPKYGQIAEKYQAEMKHAVDFEVQLGWRRQYCGIEEVKMLGVTWYFVDNEYYFKRNYVYGAGGDEYERYAFFCRACLNALPLLSFQPDVIHAHDWQSGMVPALLRIQYGHLDFYKNIRTVYTIHNLQYQGVFGIEEVRDVLSLPDEVFTDDKLECFGAANFMKAAIVYADEITTVSPSYAEEIQTAYYGERLDGLLRARRNSLSGVLNGIDIKTYDPANDPMIAATYTVEDMSGRAHCKEFLQQKLGLEVREDIPVIAMVTRLSGQKGLDLVDHVIGQLLEEDIQLVVLGMGESRYVNLFSWAEQQYPGRVAARFTMDSRLAHEIYAGADMFLMPSKFEPCGLSQMIALRYGCVPIVRETGGLRDTVLSYNHYNNAGNGFTFFNYNAHDMLFTVRRAVRYYYTKPEVWRTLQIRGMQGNYSWDASAETYMELYRSILSKEEAAPAEEVPAEKKPAVKRTRKPAAKKAEKPAEEAAATEEKPKRTRKTPAKKAEAAAEEAPAEKKPAAKRTRKAPAKKAEE